MTINNSLVILKEDDYVGCRALRGYTAVQRGAEIAYISGSVRFYLRLSTVVKVRSGP